jgi:hypothetical protein
LKKCPGSQIFRGVQKKTTRIHHFRPVRMGIVEETKATKVCKDVKGTIIHC